MSKRLKLLLVIVAVLGAYFLIVENRDAIRNNLSWVFEEQDENHTLPELSNEEIERNSLHRDTIPEMRKGDSGVDGSDLSDS